MHNSTLDSIYSLFLKSTGVSTDTRTLKPGNLFFALSGPNFNGNKFADIALDNGAIAAIVDDNIFLENVSDNKIRVKNSLQTLQALANLHRKEFKGPVIGLTGSNGKTTTKELIYQILSEKYRVHATSGNLNNHIGVPLTLLACPPNTDMMVVEMGASAQGEIAELCTIAEPTHGLITNIGKAHLEGFGGTAGVLKGKTELYRFLSNNRGSIFVDGSDNTLIHELTHSTENIYYEEADLIKSEPNIHFIYQGHLFNSKLYGAHNFQNIKAAITIGKYFSVDLISIKSAIAGFSPNNNRSSIKKVKGATVLYDAYNANPSSMQKSLESFFKLDAHPKLIILGDMLEIGEAWKKEHQKIVDLLNSKTIEYHLVGPCFRTIDKSNSFENSDQLKEFLRGIDLSGYTILLKGSRGIKLETVLD